MRLSKWQPLFVCDAAAIAAFSFFLRAVNFENGGTVLPFPRLLYKRIFRRKLKLCLRICLLPRLLSRELLQIFCKEVPKRVAGCVVIYEDVS